MDITPCTLYHEVDAVTGLSVAVLVAMNATLGFRSMRNSLLAQYDRTMQAWEVKPGLHLDLLPISYCWIFFAEVCSYLHPRVYGANCRICFIYGADISPRSFSVPGLVIFGSFSGVEQETSVFCNYLT